MTVATGTEQERGNNRMKRSKVIIFFKQLK